MSIKSLSSIIPFLTVHNGTQALEFYINALGATVVEKFEQPGGKLSAALTIEGARFFVGDEEPEFGNISPAAHAFCPVRIILQTVNADELFARALRFGGVQICPMTTEEDWRIGKLKDPFGHIWEIGYSLQ